MKFSVAIALILSVAAAKAADPLVLFDFTNPEDTKAIAENWADRSDPTSTRFVGLSSASFTTVEDDAGRRAVFKSNLVPVNNVGYTIRYLDGALPDLSKHSGFEIKCRGYGEPSIFKIQLRHNFWNAVSNTYFDANFQPPTDGFGTVFIPFSDFKETMLAAEIKEYAVRLETSLITSFGFKRTSNGNGDVFQDGEATLEVEWVKAV